MMLNTIAAFDSGLMFLLVVLCLVILSVSMLRRSQQRIATRRDLTRESLARLRDQKEVRQSMDDLLVELEECARRINAQVDTRFAKLEAVIRDADQRIARMSALLTGGAGHAGAVATDPEFRPGLPLATTPAKNPATDAATTPSEPLPRTREERFARIYQLADKGSTPMTIADALQIPLGEVELILNLRKYKQ